MAPVSLSTKAFIISSIPMGESDLLVTFLTPEAGKLRAVAKGAKKSTKRFMNALEPFTQVSACLIRSRPSGLWRLDSATILHIYETISSDYQRFVYASLCMELTELWQREGVGDSDVFGLVNWYLSKISRGSCPVTCSLIFKIRLLKSVGLLPRLDVCSVCGKRPMGRLIAFDRITGEIICASCVGRKDSMNLCLGTARSIDFIGTSSLERVGRLKLTYSQSLEGWSYMKELHCRHLHKEPSSYKFIDVSKDLKGCGYDS